MMKRCFLLLILIGLTACGGGTSSEDASGRPQYRELSLESESSDAIGTVGEVDWYHFRAVETNNVLQLRCNGETTTPEVEFLVTVYEKDANGGLVRLWADHAPENAALPANLVLNIPIPEPKDLYIAVRDLLDDGAAPQTRYRLQLAYTNPTTDNATFGQATDLGGMRTAGLCHTDAIETVGDVDCFRFSVPADGVYRVAAAFNDADISTPVRLEMKIYEADGTSVYPAAGETVLNTGYRVYLEAGTHFVALQDRGKNDADAFAQYTVCITPLTVAEVMQNDNQLTANAMVEDTGALHPKYAPVFKANNQLLKYSSLDANNQYVSDWIAGFVDYQDDQDWYVLDIEPMIPAGAAEIPEDWYYDIEVRFYTPGSDVEYTWQLYRDVSRAGAPNQVVVERTPGTTDIDYVDDRDGIMAAWATSLVTDPSAAVTRIVPDSGQPFWIGDRWQNDRFYLAVSDFNYTRLNNGSFNPVPDDDWGYDAPYYFQIRLTFHPGVSSP